MSEEVEAWRRFIDVPREMYVERREALLAAQAELDDIDREHGIEPAPWPVTPSRPMSMNRRRW